MSADPISLREAIESLRRLPFPMAPQQEDLSELHAKLADYDGYVAGYLQRLTNGDLRELPDDLIDQELGRVLRSATRTSGGHPGAQDLLAYYDRLVTVLRMASNDG